MQADSFIFDLRFMPLGFVIGFLLIPVHEFLHALCYPKGAKVYVGICLKKAAAYAVSFYPIKKSRYIVMSLAPMLLGVIPLIIFIVCPLRWKALLTVCIVPAFMGMISPSPDYMDVISVIRQVPNGAKSRLQTRDCIGLNELVRSCRNGLPNQRNQTERILHIV